MRMMFLVGAAIFIALADPVSAQGAKHYVMNVEPGETLNIGIHRRWDWNCSTYPVRVYLADAPKHGKVTIKNVKSQIPAQVGFGRATNPQCVGKPAPGVAVHYNAPKGYKGPVTLSYVADYGNTKQRFSYSITVE